MKSMGHTPASHNGLCACHVASWSGAGPEDDVPTSAGSCAAVSGPVEDRNESTGSSDENTCRRLGDGAAAALPSAAVTPAPPSLRTPACLPSNASSLPPLPCSFKLSTGLTSPSSMDAVISSRGFVRPAESPAAGATGVDAACDSPVFCASNTVPRTRDPRSSPLSGRSKPYCAPADAAAAAPNAGRCEESPLVAFPKFPDNSSPNDSLPLLAELVGISMGAGVRCARLTDPECEVVR